MGFFLKILIITQAKKVKGVIVSTKYFAFCALKELKIPNTYDIKLE